MEVSKIIKIAVVGPESTGKSTLCELLAQHYNTVYVPEYAREYFTKNMNIDHFSLSDLESVYIQQIENEQKAMQTANRFLFCDTTLITGKIWCLEDFNQVPGFISDNITKIKYDLYLLSNNDVAWEKDELRKGSHNRDYIFTRNKEELELLNAHYRIIAGTDSDRLNGAIKHIEELFKI